MAALPLSRLVATGCLGLLLGGCATTEPVMYRLSLGSQPPPPLFGSVPATVVYAGGESPGFEPGARLTALPGGGVVSDEPFYLTVPVSYEHNWRVTVTLVNPRTDVPAFMTVKAELRRLMLESVRIPPGGAVTRSFLVNTRTPRIIAKGAIAPGVVRLKAPRETTQEAWAWDPAITLEFNGDHPAVRTVVVEPVGGPTLFLLGDSTVCDQSREPYNSWGQMLPRFFGPGIAVANHAESGETYRDSIGRRRLDKIISVMQPGDWLFLQFGHNDQKQIAAGTGGPFTTYREELKAHLAAVRQAGGRAVVLSPMERRGFDDAGKIIPSLADYARAARETAAEAGVTFIDLNALSRPFYEALGPERSALAFAAPGGKQDNTHHNNYGSYELARIIVQSIRDQRLDLARFIIRDIPAFDPAHPDPVGTFAVPASPNFSNQRPLGD